MFFHHVFWKVYASAIEVYVQISIEFKSRFNTEGVISYFATCDLYFGIQWSFNNNINNNK